MFPFYSYWIGLEHFREKRVSEKTNNYNCLLDKTNDAQLSYIRYTEVASGHYYRCFMRYRKNMVKVDFFFTKEKSSVLYL